MKNLLKLLVGTVAIWFTAEYYYHKGKVVALEAASKSKQIEGLDVDVLIDHMRDEKYLDELGFSKSAKRRLLRVGREVKKASERGY